MTYEEFHHGLRILLGIETIEAMSAGAIADDDRAGQRQFEANPFLFFIRAGDERGRRLFGMIETRARRGGQTP